MSITVILVQLMGSRLRVMLFAALNILLIGSMGGWSAYAASLHTQGAADQAFSQASPAQLTGVVPSPLNQSVDIARFQQAIAEDLSGHPSAARSIYDVLKDTEMSDQIAVPSAINLAVLGRLDEARSAFAGIALSKDRHEANYAQLWLLWIAARTNGGKAILLRQQLGEMAKGSQMALPYQQAIAELYAGRGNAGAAFQAIEAMPNLSDLERQNFITEATFFTGGYLRYVNQDNQAALRLFKRYQGQLCLLSLERPLINTAIAELTTARQL